MTQKELQQKLMTDISNYRIGTELFIDKKLKSVNFINKAYLSPLMLSAHNGSIYIVKTLLDAGADVNISNKFKLDALAYAASSQHIKVMELLIKNDAKLINDGGDIIYYYSIYRKISNWLKSERTQKLLLSKEPTLIKSMIDYNILSPKIQAEFSYLINATELNLL